MSRNNQIRKLQLRTQSLNRLAASFVLFRAFHRNKRAVSAVVSNLILIGAVITIGIVTLSYARSMAVDYQTDYAHTMGDDISKLKESLVFEHADYKSNQLSVYILNSGSINVTISSISINNSPITLSLLQIYRMDNLQPITNFNIDKGVEAKIVIVDTLAIHSGDNIIKIISRSNSNFAYNFLA
jgi:hypothetical protein